MTAHIIIVGSEKGGVGKTFFSRASIAYLEKRPAGPVEYEAFDGQKPLGILKRFHPEHTTVVDIRKSDDQVKLFDRLRPNSVKLIDLAAGDLVYSLDLVRELDFLEDVKRGALKMSVFHVIGSTKSSFDEIAPVKKLVAGARHFLVKSHVNDAAFLGLSRDAVDSVDGVIEIPQLDALAAETVDQKGVGFNQFIANEDNHLVLRRKVQHWLGLCFASLAAVH